MSYDTETTTLGVLVNNEDLLARQYVNNHAFYMIVPEPYRQYYLRFVRPYFWWYDGYVPYFHNTTTGIMPTNLSRVLARKLANLTTGSKLLFDDEDTPDKEFVKYKGKEYSTLDFIEEWSKCVNLNTKVTQDVEWAYVGGDSLLKLDNVQGDLAPKILRKDEYYFSTDFSGNITNIVMYLYERNDVTKEGVARQFYLVEEREYDDNGKPKWRVNVKMGTGSRPTYKDIAPVELADVKIDQLPDKVRSEFRRLFPKVMLGEWKDLPMKSLGVYIIKTSEKVSFMPALPFGESLFSTLTSLFFTYDYYYNYFNNDMFLGQGRVLIPDLWQSSEGKTNPMEQKFFTKIPYANNDSQTPISLQFDLRGADWVTTRNNILQTIAMHLGVNERTIMTSIVPASEKPSAHEVSSDENSTTLFIENQRRFLKTELDKMIEDVLDFYGVKEEKVYVKFSKLGLTNIQNIVTIVSTLKDRNLVDTETALEMIFTDKNNRQIRVIHDRIKAEQEVKMKHENDMKEKSLQQMDKEQYQQNVENVGKAKE